MSMGHPTRARQHQCSRCGKLFTSAMRLLHHRAAEHAPRTMKDIATMKHIRHTTGRNGRSND
jgi:hypothetical protein